MEKNNHAYSQVCITVDVFENSASPYKTAKSRNRKNRQKKEKNKGTAGGEDGRLLGVRLFLH